MLQKVIYGDDAYTDQAIRQCHQFLIVIYAKMVESELSSDFVEHQSYADNCSWSRGAEINQSERSKGKLFKYSINR